MHISVNLRGRLALFAQCAGTLHATHELELEGDCARCDPARRYQGAISRARPARTRSANRHLHGLLHRTRGTPPARGAPRWLMSREERGGRITSGSEAAISLSKDATSIPTGRLMPHNHMR